ncbi:RagB/SusD family nutrient uptake outer membrane protein [Parabacteroides chongii]|uniref:RagB/SusD family nutrient uptake outer membrane protein n=1 Tax=Parabacteroides chongii TaxID=2685834 RepID=UPI00240E4282|nr:RagB/SusD family nutrient uptake outer membrane protein [Parabacteroides chongii]WFE86477.1 RagB/SusD family nutrient uptake outer membrane protein [Parabacteroides chongii]
MNKFRFKLYTIAASLFLLLSSCNDDFLERSPIVNISDANFWKTANDLELYANNFYNRNDLLNSYGDWGSIGPYGLDADNGTDTQVAYNYNTRMNGEATNPASGGGWAVNDWASLRNINYFMANYNKVDAPWDQVKVYVGESLFFRSLFYFGKLKTFGDLPWITSTLDNTSNILYEGRLPRNQVVDSIMLDLDKAIEYLPERGPSYTGRITKEVALLLQARIALYEGTWEKYHGIKNTPFKVVNSDGTKFIQKAAEASNILITLAESNGNTKLADCTGEAGYTNLFNQRDYSSNKEVLLWRKYSVNDGQYTRWGAYYYGAGRGLTKSLVDSYLCMDGKPISVSDKYLGDKTLKNVVANRDPRLNQTIFVDDGKHILFTDNNTFFATPGFEGVIANSCPTGYQLYKGFNTNYTECINQQSTIGTIYFRYAEALLIYAEAKAELGTITQMDIDRTINALRNRVGMNEGLLNMNNIVTDPNWEFKNISPLLNEIRRERKVEFACEGFRRDDIFRWAVVDEVMVGKKPKGAVKSQWENYPNTTDAFVEAWSVLGEDENGYIDPFKSYPAMDNGYRFNLGRDYLQPLPTNELTLNPELGQNPGW